MMDEAVELSIARDYSRFPSGRDHKDGPNNGTRFRDHFLLPRFQEARDKSIPLIVKLEGVLSFGSSFLEEAFGGLVRVHGIPARHLTETLRVDPGSVSNERYRDAILRYIKDASA